MRDSHVARQAACMRPGRLLSRCWRQQFSKAAAGWPLRLAPSHGSHSRAGGHFVQQQRQGIHLTAASLGGAPAEPASPSASPSPNSPSTVPATPKRYAVIGGGFAGVAVSWHLLSRASPSQPIALDLYDAFGLGAGGSGAAAGLLHPYTNRGKVLWRGLEAFQAALELVQVAEVAAAAPEGVAASGGQAQEGFVWKDGILRPARSQKQARELAKFVPQDPATAAATGAELLAAEPLQQLVPGLPVGSLMKEDPGPAAPPSPQQLKQHARQQRQQRRRGQQLAEGGATSTRGPGPVAAAAGPTAAANPAVPVPEPGAAAGLMAHKAVVLHPLRYLQAVWAACCQLAQRAGHGSAARLVMQPVASLRQLEGEAGPYDAVVVAAGAAVGGIAELEGLLPISLCQGYTLIMEPPGEQAQQAQHAQHAQQDSEGSRSAGSAGSRVDPSVGRKGYPAGAPSLLGPTYIAAHGPGSLVVGATKRNGLTPGEAFEECRRQEVAGAEERGEAVAGLLPPAGELWPPVLGWHVAQVKSGVRALPARGSDGSLPFAGRVPAPALPLPSSPSSSAAAAAPPAAPDSTSSGSRGEQQQEEGVTKEGRGLGPAGNWWFVGGLGARGLVYHAWLGKVVAEAVTKDDESVLPNELLRWRGD